MNSQSTTRIIDMTELLKRIPASKPTIYRWVSQGRFPRPRKYGIQLSGWPESEINAWIEERMAT